VEEIVLGRSEVINVLGSDAAVRGVIERVRHRRPRPVVLAHGHKIGAAFISGWFADSPALRRQAIAGLVRDISACAELGRVFHPATSALVSPDDAAIVRVSDRPEFWLPEETYRYVQVMPADNLAAVANLLAGARRFLQTVVAAVPDDQLLPALHQFGASGASNIHFPGSAPLLNVFEEPHDGEFDALKARYPYRPRFASTNFKRNADWLDT
jgi:hypothetical protein